FECLPDPLVRCIPKHWQCDGRKDCAQGEDEAPSKCRTKTKKGTRSRGSLVDTFRCLPNYFRCPRTRTCIHMSQLCDGFVNCPLDYADEGAHCRNRACRSKKCPENMCSETIQGAVCYCPEGLESNGTHCTDLDECKYGSFCDQGCNNTDRGYECSCVDGYIYVPEGNCKINIHDENAYLYVANYVNVEAFDLASHLDRYNTRSNIRRVPVTPNHQEPGHGVTMLDVNVQDETLCYLERQSSSTQPEDQSASMLLYKLMCVGLKKDRKTWEIPIPYPLNAHSSDGRTVQQTDIKSFARDWLSGNWYFSDMAREFIFMCAP
ncbi:hypothetical protein EGW08_016331, partial [Elysia chlorotica]